MFTTDGVSRQLHGQSALPPGKRGSVTM